MMATINSSPTKVEPGGSSSSASAAAAAAAGSSANPTVMAVVKHEDADEEIDVDDSKLEVSTLDLGRSDSMPVMCGVVSMLDHLLVTSLTYYLASLFIYLFCRKPNPDIPTTSEMTLRVSDFEKFNPITFYILETTYYIVCNVAS